MDGLQIATAASDLQAASQLVAAAYARAGLRANNVPSVPKSPARGEVLIDKRGGVVLYTATLTLDGPEGLPMDRVFGDVLAGLPGCAEVGRLAGADGQPFAAALPLMSYVVERARELGVVTLLCMAHPSHARAYRRLFGAELVTADVRPCFAVGGAPAVALRLKIAS